VAPKCLRKVCIMTNIDIRKGNEVPDNAKSNNDNKHNRDGTLV
jgi:hypothetical protein